MEALTAAAGAGLAIYDMVKAIDRGLVLTDLCLLEKAGGRSGHWVRPKGRPRTGRRGVM
jgi:cyclic pyranopterin phosphate synthase